jgi:hypothetical protein
VLDTSWCEHATGAEMPSWSDALERHVGARREAR